jgi:biotin carboxylase
MPGPSPLRLLLLFQGPWEDECVELLRQTREVQLEREGFESYGYPRVLRLLHFDAAAYAQRLVAGYRGRIDAVWSNDDQFGCLLAAVVAKALGLPGADPAAIVRAQHKPLLRSTLARAMPEHTVAAAALPFPLVDRRCRQPEALEAAVAELGLSWPLFCKPAKGTFSALARRVEDAQQLAAHLRLSLADRWLLRWLQRPFRQLAAPIVPLPTGPDHVMLEAPMQGQQVNVDGYAERGEVVVLGVVDELMYPGEVHGARHFAGFTLPSRLPAEMAQKVAEVAVAAVRAIGYDHGLWNAELFVLPDGRVQVIEINPRSAGQFATMYRAVQGVEIERLGMQLAAGISVRDVPRLQPTAGAAASFVFRRFDGLPGVMPTDADRQWVAASFPGSRLWTEPASPGELRREYRWLGSHRYAVWNHAADDYGALLRDGAAVARRLFGVVLPFDAG